MLRGCHAMQGIYDLTWDGCLLDTQGWTHASSPTRQCDQFQE